MDKILRINQYISAGVFIVLVLLLNSNESDIWLIVLAAVMAVNVVVSFFIIGKKKVLRKG